VIRCLRISEAAQQEIYAIWSYIAEQSGSSETADRFVAEIAKRYGLLCEFGESGRSREELGPGVRSFAVGNYIIYYRLRDEIIEIAHIAHGARLPENVFSQE
jgi:toxin ParE1/3/4